MSAVRRYDRLEADAQRLIGLRDKAVKERRPSAHYQHRLQNVRTQQLRIVRVPAGRYVGEG